MSALSFNATSSSLSVPRATIIRSASGNGRCSALASSHDQYYRSEQALTIALMGLLAEESLIAQRLAKLGRKKNSA
jgi:hypothetical protein